MCDYFGLNLQTLPVIKHIKAKRLRTLRQNQMGVRPLICLCLGMLEVKKVSEIIQLRGSNSGTGMQLQIIMKGPFEKGHLLYF